MSPELATHRLPRTSVWGAGALALLLSLVLVTAVSSSASADVAGGPTPGSAVPLPVDLVAASFTATTFGMASAPGSLAAGQPVFHDVSWYAVSVDEPTELFVRATTASHGGWDATLELWTADGDLVAQSDGAGGLDPSLTVRLQAGTDYVIGLGSADAATQGRATLTVGSAMPAAPSGVTAVAGADGVTVSWDATGAADGVTSYAVLCRPAGGAEFPCGGTAGEPPVTRRTVTGLDPSTTWTFRVTASSILGAGEPSASSEPVEPVAPVAPSPSVAP